MTKRKDRVEAGLTTIQDDDPVFNAQPIATEQPRTLLELALAYFDLHASDVFTTRELAPGVLRIITVDARKFTYPPQD